MDPRVLYKPSPWQSKFHALGKLGIREALGAGSAGPGKTTALLNDCNDQITVEHERCANARHMHHQAWGESSGWAIHLRRTRLNLEQTIKNSHKLFKTMDPGASWNEQKSTWTFTSGFRYQFGHCKDPNDWENFLSFEFCVAEHTPVLMADGSWKAIQDVTAGEEVMTLEGARAVTATWDSGVQPCVAVTTSFQGEIVGRQIHPTTHPVLLLSSDESPESSSASHSGTSRTGQESGLCWQDYESLLCGRPKSEVKRVSSIDLQSGVLTYRGSPLEASQLPAYCVPVALHLPPQALEGGFLSLPTEFGTSRESSEVSNGSRRALEPQSAGRFANRQQAAGVPLRDLGRVWGTCACGTPSELTGSGKARGCPGNCPSFSHFRGELPREGLASALNSVRRRADAVGRAPTSSAPDGQGGIPTHNPPKRVNYPHFYTGEPRRSTEEFHRGEAKIEFAGFFRTYDLTVEGSNHYITHTGLVNANTAIYFDELTAFNEEQYDQICTRLRSSDPVLSTMLKVRAMSNPLMRMEGSEKVVIHDPHWVRRRFVDPAPQGNVILKKKLTRGDGTVEWHKWIYLPARLHDNPDKDFVKGYELQLLNSPPHMRAALLDGDWYVTVGSFFAEYWNKNLHVCRPFKIPTDWRVFRSMDWGFKAPGVIHWYALDDEDTLFVIKELRFQGKTDSEVAAMVKAVEQTLDLWDDRRDCSRITGPADTQLWEQRGGSGKNMGQVFLEAGVPWLRADKRSRQTNAGHVIKRLSDHDGGTRVPGLVIFETCKYVISTIPAIQTSQHNSEEPADGGDDHAIDSLFYGCAFASKGKAAIPPRTSEKSEWDDEEDAAVPARRGRHGYGQELC